MKNKIPEYALVRDIQIQPRTNDLLLATHGRGIIVFMILPMRRLSMDVASKEVHLFSNDPVKLTMGDFGGWVPLQPMVGFLVTRFLFLQYSIILRIE